MSANFFLDATGAFKKIEAVKKAMEVDMRQVLGEAMTDAKSEIDKRTRGGSDVEGSPFKGYSPAYAKFKSKKGRGTNVDLTLGIRTSKKSPPPGMLRSMQTKVEQFGKTWIGSIYFPASQQAKARGNQALRNFFALSKSQLDKIERKIKDAINGR